MDSVYLVREGLCLFGWQNSCLQAEGVDADLPCGAVQGHPPAGLTRAWEVKQPNLL